MIRNLTSWVVLIFWIVQASVQADKPNIMFILADDCTYRDLEVYGGPAKTPNMNKLADEGMRFNRCYQAASMCSPTRHNLYTGIYPVHSGAYPNHTFADPGTKSIVHHLQASGYRVALTGKTHVEPKTVFPFEYLEGMEYDYRDTDKTPEEDVIFRNPALKNFIKECSESGTPFCIFAASFDPHSPYTRGQKYRSYYELNTPDLPPNIFDTPELLGLYKNYLAECTFFDQQVGECLSYLDEFGVKENSLVMVATEQGSSFPFGKWNNYEHSLGSGLLVRWPKKIAKGSQSDAIVEYCDVVPTLVEAVGGKLVDEVDGNSFLDVLTGKAATHDAYACGSQTFSGVNGNKEPYGMRTVVNTRYRYIRNLKPENPITYSQTSAFLPKLNPRQKSWKGDVARLALDGNVEAQAYIKRMTYRPPEELYDIKNDPYCMENLIQNPELQSVKMDLSKKLDDWMTAQGDLGWKTELKAKERSKKFSTLWEEIKKTEGCLKP